MVSQNKKGQNNKDAHVPMVWDKILNKLQKVNADSFAADV